MISKLKLKFSINQQSDYLRETNNIVKPNVRILQDAWIGGLVPILDFDDINADNAISIIANDISTSRDMRTFMQAAIGAMDGGISLCRPNTPYDVIKTLSTLKELWDKAGVPEECRHAYVLPETFMDLLVLSKHSGAYRTIKNLNGFTVHYSSHLPSKFNTRLSKGHQPFSSWITRGYKPRYKGNFEDIFMIAAQGHCILQSYTDIEMDIHVRGVKTPTYDLSYYIDSDGVLYKERSGFLYDDPTRLAVVMQ